MPNSSKTFYSVKSLSGNHFIRLQKLGKTQKGDLWVPHLLSEDNKAKRCDNSLLALFKRKQYLHKIMTHNEK